MEPGKEPARSSLDDLDPSWRASPIGPAAPAAPAPPSPAAVPTPPPAAELSPIEEPESVEELEEEPAAPLPASIKITVLASMILGAALVVHFTGPQRELSRGMALLSKARNSGDAKTAAAALAVLEPYVDSTRQGYDALFEAASLAGDDAAGAKYAEKLAKSPPEEGSALLVWYESALIYRTLAVKSDMAAFETSAVPAERRSIVDKIRAHREAAAALKPTREKAVEYFSGGFPSADGARLMRIDDMQAKLSAVDPEALLALAVSTGTR